MIQIMANLSEAMGARRQWNNIVKLLKKKKNPVNPIFEEFQK